MFRSHHTIIKRNRLLYMISSVGGHAYILVTLPILTGQLPPNHFGFYVILVQVVTIVQAASLTLFSSSLLRFYAEYEGEERRQFVGTVFLSFFVLQALIALGLYLGRHHWLLLVFPNITVSLDPYVLYAMVWMTLVSLRGITLTLVKSIERPSLSLVQILVYGILFISSLFGLVIQAGWGLQGALLSLVAAEAGTLFILMYFLKKQVACAWRPWYIKKVLSFSAPLAASSLVFILFSNIDRVVLSRYVNLADLGIYGVGFMIGNIAALVVTSNMSAYSPRMLKVMKSEGNEAAKSLSTYFIQDAFALMGLVVAVLVLFNDLFLFYLGSGEKAMAASLVVVGIAAGHLARSQYLFIRHGLFSVNRTGIILLLDVALLGLGFALAHLLAWSWGMQGVGFTFLVSYLLIIPFATISAKHHFPITIPFGPVVKTLFFLSLLTALEVYLNTMDRSLVDTTYWVVKSVELLVAISFYWTYIIGLLRPLGAVVRAGKV